jgi:hypothetical protein
MNTKELEEWMKNTIDGRHMAMKISFPLATHFKTHPEKIPHSLIAELYQAAATGQGMKWVKASERIPIDGVYFSRYDEEDSLFTVLNNGKPYKISFASGQTYRGGLIDLNKLVWLDQSPQPDKEPESQRGEEVGTKLTAEASHLIAALLNGKNIIRRFRDEEEILWCEYSKDNKPHFYVRGWGSALGNSKDRVMSILENPEQWEIESTPTSAKSNDEEVKAMVNGIYKRHFTDNYASQPDPVMEGMIKYAMIEAHKAKL